MCSSGISGQDTSGRRYEIGRDDMHLSWYICGLINCLYIRVKISSKSTRDVFSSCEANRSVKKPCVGALGGGGRVNFIIPGVVRHVDSRMDCRGRSCFVVLYRVLMPGVMGVLSCSACCSLEKLHVDG